MDARSRSAKPPHDADNCQRAADALGSAEAAIIPASPIDDLRSAVAWLDRANEPGPRRVAEGLRRYLEQAEDGTTLERAVGLAPQIGHERWVTVEARKRRDSAFLKYRREFLADLKISEAAKEIEAALRDFRRAGRLGKLTSVSDARSRLLTEIYCSGAKLPKRRQLQNILGNEVP